MNFMSSTKNEMCLHKYALLYQLVSFIWELHVLEPCLAQWTLREHSHKASYLHFFGSQIVIKKKMYWERTNAVLFIPFHSFFCHCLDNEIPFYKIVDLNTDVSRQN